MALATTKMSSRGQVVIPEEIREALHVGEGAHFVVFHHADTVVLKLISEPTQEQFQDMLDKARNQARKAGLKKADLNAAIKRVRAAK